MKKRILRVALAVGLMLFTSLPVYADDSASITVTAKPDFGAVVSYLLMFIGGIFILLFIYSVVGED